MLERLGVSGRAADVAWLITWHYASREIGDVLGVSEATVKMEIRHVCAWLRVRKRRELGRVVRRQVEGARPVR